MNAIEQWEKTVKAMRAKGCSWDEIVGAIAQNFPLLTYPQIREKARNVIRRPIAKTSIGIIGDYHAPFNHPNYLQFVQDTFKQYRVGSVVSVGDLVDHHAISRFQADPSARGAYDELDKAIDEVQKVVETFPNVKMCKGNHDTIPTRQAASIGIGERYLKPYHELVGLPKTWEIEDEFIIDNVLYLHGINCMGKNGAINAAVQERMSLVMGHAHSFGGVAYSANKRSLIFGMNVGCGIDVDAYAFAYGKHAKLRPTLGCGIVFNESNAIFVPMGKEYFRN